MENVGFKVQNQMPKLKLGDQVRTADKRSHLFEADTYVWSNKLCTIFETIKNTVPAYVFQGLGRVSKSSTEKVSVLKKSN